MQTGEDQVSRSNALKSSIFTSLGDVMQACEEMRCALERATAAEAAATAEVQKWIMLHEEVTRERDAYAAQIKQLGKIVSDAKHSALDEIKDPVLATNGSIMTAKERETTDLYMNKLVKILNSEKPQPMLLINVFGTSVLNMNSEEAYARTREALGRYGKKLVNDYVERTGLRRALKAVLRSLRSHTSSAENNKDPEDEAARYKLGFEIVCGVLNPAGVKLLVNSNIPKGIAGLYYLQLILIRTIEDLGK